MQKLAINKQSWLRVLFGVYLFPLSLVCFSLSVPPADLPLCALMFVLASVGLFLARGESRAWRVIWTSALIVSIVCAVLEVVAGQRIARQSSKHESSMRDKTANKITAHNAGWPPQFRFAVHGFGSGVCEFWR